MKTCPHLEPLERELEARGIILGEGQRNPYGDPGIWFEINCVFDEPSLRARLHITDPPVTYDEYDGRASGSDATWLCNQCQRAIFSSHPRYARPDWPRIS